MMKIRRIQASKLQINKMASIVIMIGRAVINMTAFAGGSYLTEYLSGDQNMLKKRRGMIIALQLDRN